MGLRGDFLSEHNINSIINELRTKLSVRDMMETYPVSDLATYGEDRRYQLRQVNAQFIQYYRSVFNNDPFDRQMCDSQVYSKSDAAVAQLDIFKSRATNAGFYDMDQFNYLFGRKLCDQELRQQYAPFRNVNNYKGINNPHIIGMHKRHIEKDPEYFEESMRDYTREGPNISRNKRDWRESAGGNLWNELHNNR